MSTLNLYIYICWAIIVIASIYGIIKERKETMWIVADWLDRFGVELGFLLLISPIVYDIIGIAYGRDLIVKVETSGCIVQIIGAIIMLVSKYIKKTMGG